MPSSAARTRSKRSRSRLSERLGSASFLKEWLRQPSFDVAEAVLRLRQRRGLSQEALAEQLGTRQPAIARLESGTANPRLSTLAELARALDAVVRIDFVPCEIAQRDLPDRWWERDETCDP